MELEVPLHKVLSAFVVGVVPLVPNLLPLHSREGLLNSLSFRFQRFSPLVHLVLVVLSLPVVVSVYHVLRSEGCGFVRLRLCPKVECHLTRFRNLVDAV